MNAAPGGSNTPSKKNERRYARHEVDMRVLVQVFRDGNTVAVWGRSNEMGEDGISATLTGELAPGEVVTMEFTLPLSTDAMRLRAVVRYRGGFRYGFEFLTLRDAQRSAIRRALDVLLPGQ